MFSLSLFTLIQKLDDNTLYHWMSKSVGRCCKAVNDRGINFWVILGCFPWQEPIVFSHLRAWKLLWIYCFANFWMSNLKLFSYYSINPNFWMLPSVIGRYSPYTTFWYSAITSLLACWNKSSPPILGNFSFNMSTTRLCSL